MKFYEREPFDDQKVEAIKIQLQNLSVSGKPADYQVILDDMEIVPRTNNVDQFITFYDLIGHNSKNLTINVYSGATRHKRTYSFYFNEGNSAQGLNGIGAVDPQKHFDERLARVTAELENKQLSTLVKDLKDSVLELEDEIEELRTDNKTLTEDLRKQVGEGGIAGTIMGGVERMFSKYMPGHEANLAGAPQSNVPPVPIVAPGTFNVPVKQYDNFQTFSAIANQFTEDEFAKVLTVLDFMAKNKPAVDEIVDFITEDKPE
ncbi:hypothetical protein BH11BAC7_BH11BAC7_21320 [soil metagenome]